jgi:hypothetical protein
VRVDTAVSPAGALQPGADGEMKLRFSGQASPDCYGVPVKPVDAVVVMDTSPSAGRPVPQSNFCRGQLILQSLWAQMDQPVYVNDGQAVTASRLAIVTVDIGTTTPDEVHVRMPFTSTTSVITSTIAGLENGADSGFDKGIAAATQLLPKQAVVQQEVDAAKRVANVFVVGNRLYVREAEQLTRPDATALAGSPDRVLFDPSAADLRRLFVAAAESKPSVLGRVLTVYQELPNPSPLEIRPSDIGGGGVLEGNRVVWRPGAVLAPGLDLSYRFKLSSAATGSFEAGVGVNYVDCNGFLHAYVTGDGAIVGTPIARSPLNVAVPTTQPGGTSVTPRPTSAVPPPPPPGECTIRVGSVQLPCWLVILLAALLLLLLLLLLWLLFRRKPQRKPVPPSVTPPLPTPPTSAPAHLPRPVIPAPGEKVEPGRAPEDIALRQALAGARTLSGRIPTAERGPARSSVLLRVYDTSAEFFSASGLAVPENSVFMWRRDGVETEVPLRLLKEVLAGRVRKESPLLAAWTQTPADNATINTFSWSDPAQRRIMVGADTSYARPGAGQTQAQRSYWLELEVLDRPANFTIVPQPVNQS